MKGLLKDNGFSLRVQMVERARAKGISAAARELGTSRLTVRTWKSRYEQEGLKGLEERSRAPKKRPGKIREALEQKIRDLRGKYRWGPDRLKVQCGLPCSTGAIYRVLKQGGMIQRRKKKWEKKRDLREQKKKLKPFEKLQVDVKDLCDIPEYWEEGKAKGLPRYQVTMRDVRTGTMFVAYAYANDGDHAAAFAAYLLEELKRYGVDSKTIRIQTDNGSEFIGSVTKKSPEPSAFQQVLKHYEVPHERIPPRCSTWNSDVETVHRTIEDELYTVERFDGIRTLLGKAYTYQLFYNHFRKNRWRGNQSPREILESLPGHDYSPNIFSLPPIILDHVLSGPLPGKDVPEAPR
jgi:transposase